MKLDGSPYSEEEATRMDEFNVLRAKLEQKDAELAALKERLAQMEAALRPFVTHASYLPLTCGDGYEVDYRASAGSKHAITIEDFVCAAKAVLTDAPSDSVVVPREALDAQHALGYRDAHIEIRDQGKVVVPMEKLREMQEYIDGNLVPVGNQIAVVNQLHARTALLDWLAALLKETGCSTVEE